MNKYTHGIMSRGASNTILNLTMIRTRAIIEHLSYDDLVKRGIIPDLYHLIQQSQTTVAIKRYPPFVYAVKDFAFFGMFYDYVIRAGLRINLAQVTNLGTDPITDVIQRLSDEQMMQMMMHLSTYETSKNIHDIARTSLELTSGLYGQKSYSQENIQGYVPTIVNVIKEIVAKWNVYSGYLNGTVRFNVEYTHNAFAGHPDIVTDQCVLDIKTTCSFSKMAKEACLQVLAYYALMKLTVPTVQYVGFVLPMQRDVAIYNMGNWDSSHYLHLLSTEANKLALASPQPTQQIQNQQLPEGAIFVDVDDDGNIDFEALTRQITGLHLDDMPFDEREELTQALVAALQQEVANIPRVRIGGHIAKGKNIATTLRDFATNCPGAPCQMFLGNPRTGKKDAKTAGQINDAAEVIKDTGLQYFTHAPYVINLCANQSNSDGSYWQQNMLNEDLAYTAAMGGKGVVVHTGARKHLPENEALFIMEYMVRTALPHATESCPLLLETPCNEGTEVCGQIHELGNFFYRFNEQERKKLGICIDTCHVFAAAYDPLAYLQHWEKYCGVPIKLVHFNDSKGALGCCTDRHAAPGHGHIGMEKMQAIAAWCHERNIPMVRE